SHLWLEITDGVTAADIDINGKLVGPQTYSGSSSSDNDGWPTYDDDGLPGTPEAGIPMYALKFDFGPDPYEIITERSPVYGNYFAKGGQSYVWNLGMESYDGTAFSGESISDFIVRPDGYSRRGGGGGGSSVPEPGTILLLGVGFLALALYGWRKKRS
ncbi:PEP-CTERM sorting domain-containing protein, partial [Candidatus Moduliflexota bacterium]